MARPHGTKYIKTPNDLLSMWEEYKEKLIQNPDTQEIATPRGVVEIKVKKPLIIKGFYSFVYKTYKHHVHQYFENTGNAYSDYLGVVTYIRDEAEDDQVSGSLTGRYKSPNLVARINGYADKSNVNLTQEQPLFPDNK